MNDPERYDLVFSFGDAFILPVDDGGFVRYEDYAAMRDSYENQLLEVGEQCDMLMGDA